MKHLKFLFALGGILFLSCQTVSARGLKIPFGDREVLTKVADLPDTEEYQTDDGNYIDLATFHQEFNIAYLLPLYIEKEPRQLFFRQFIVSVFLFAIADQARLFLYV